MRGAPGVPEAVVLHRLSRGWPDRLEHLADPPDRLWVLGRAQPSVRAVAVVGSRRATIVGRSVARDLGYALAEAGVQVVSGLARGVDGEAHRGALAAGGETVAVLGCGVDICYPLEHRRLRDQVVAAGAVISEDPPGTEPAPWRFPRRNRIIAALVMAVVVVEAGERSGALSTARHAADLGREVLAVPGSVRSPQSAGTNRLVRDGATPLLDPGDVFEAVPGLAPPPPHGRRHEPPGPCLDPELSALLDLVAGGPVHPDTLAETTGASAAEVAARLSALELLGLVAGLPGGLVQRRPGGRR